MFSTLSKKLLPTYVISLKASQVAPLTFFSSFSQKKGVVSSLSDFSAPKTIIQEESNSNEVEVVDEEEAQRSLQELEDQSKSPKFMNYLERISIDELTTLTERANQVPALAKNQKFWLTLRNEIEKDDRLEDMEVDELVKIVYNFAVANQNDEKFFQKMESALFHQGLEEELDYRHIAKLLWAFSHANHGSTILYYTLATKIKNIYFEFTPVQLAEFAYYFSKASNSMKGGFGVFSLAETQIKLRLWDCDILAVKKICEYLIAQNIGSNAFQLAVEERIEKIYPQEIEPATLVSLIKSTSGYRFQTDLIKRLQKDAVKYSPYLSNEQVQTILWSFNRGKKGTEHLYKKLEEEFVKRVNTLSTRGVAFSLNCFLDSNHVSEPLLEKYYLYIEKNADKFSVHYCLKILKHIKNAYKSEYCNKIIIEVVKRLNSTQLTHKIHELIAIMESLDGLLIIQNEEVQNLYANIEKKILHLIKSKKKFNSTQAAHIFNCFVRSHQGSTKFLNRVVSLITDLNSLPKDVFAPTFFSFVEMGLDEQADGFLIILNEMALYGNVSEFFSLEDYVLVNWSLSTLISKDKEVMTDVAAYLQQDFKEKIFEIDPNLLAMPARELHSKLWLSLGNWIEYTHKDEEAIYERMSSLNQENKDQIVDHETFLTHSPVITDQAYDIAYKYCEEHKTGEFELLKDITDQFFNMINVFILDSVTDKKSAILIVKPWHYTCISKAFGEAEAEGEGDIGTDKNTSNNDKLSIGKADFRLTMKNKIDGFKANGFNVLTIDENEWLALNEEGQKKVVLDFLQSIYEEDQVKK